MALETISVGFMRGKGGNWLCVIAQVAALAGDIMKKFLAHVFVLLSFLVGSSSAVQWL